MTFVEALCNQYKTLFESQIAPVLEIKPKVVGLTLGMDRGQLIKVYMNEDDEYVGRPINVACRLQSAVKDGGDPANKMLITKHLHVAIKSEIASHHFGEVKRKLRNIAGDQELSFMKVDIFKQPPKRVEPLKVPPKK
jgi:class 3 adenylate cyclase